MITTLTVILGAVFCYCLICLGYHLRDVVDARNNIKKMQLGTKRTGTEIEA